MKKATFFTLLTVFALIPLTLFLGTRLRGRWYYFTSTLMILEIMVPFFLTFESRRPQARELAVIAVLCALATASRFAIPLPHFKPIFAVIMIAGIAFGPQSGFLVGAVSAFASNFLVSQGPWTPWQMLAYGVAGLLAGCFFRLKKVPRRPVVMAVFGFVCVVSVVGVLMDCSTVFTALTTLKWSAVLFILGQGLPANAANATCTAITLLLLGKPLLDILERIRTKYGMTEPGSGPV